MDLKWTGTLLTHRLALFAANAFGFHNVIESVVETTSSAACTKKRQSRVLEAFVRPQPFCESGAEISVSPPPAAAAVALDLR